MAVSISNQSNVGIVGLGETGRNVALNLADHHFQVAAFDLDPEKRQPLPEQSNGARIPVAASASKFATSLQTPRTILVFSRESASVRAAADQLLPHLAAGDLVIDAGESFFKDAPKHGRHLSERGVEFMALGLGGGQHGARHGAIVKAGGAGREHRMRVRPMLEAMSANIRGEPCLSFFKTAAAAHFVRMVHAGVEYCLLQLLSETFDLLQRALLLTTEEMHDASGAWHLCVLNGYLMEVSCHVFEAAARSEPRILLEDKLAQARQDPLGRWAVQSAWELEVEMPVLEATVGPHRVSSLDRRRDLQAAVFRQPTGRLVNGTMDVLDELHGALHAAMLITYAQGVDLLAAASKHHGFEFALHEITHAWRGCTHLRTSLLEEITAALGATPDLPGLLSDDDLSERVMSCQEHLRRAVWRAHKLDADVPALLAALDYLDANRRVWLPFNLIQAQDHYARQRAVLV